MNCLLAWENCRDDWADEKKLSAAAAGGMLAPGAKKAAAQYPEKAAAIRRALGQIAQAEADRAGYSETPANAFGDLMAELFTVRDDRWTDGLRRFARSLGKLIYFMDAACDLQADRKKGQYNPLLLLGIHFQTASLAKVGDDTFGRLLVGTMQRAGIDGCGIRIDPDTFTTLAFVTFDAHGDRSFAFARKPGADTQLRWDEIDPAMLDETHVFHFGSLSCTDEPARSATQSAVAYARAHGKLVTYDPNYRPPLWKMEQEAKEQILWGLRQADLVKISDEEVQFLWGCSPEQGAERVLALGAKLVMVTLGPKGCFLKNAQAEYRCGCPQVRTVDTTGAGDIFGGSAVSRFLELGKTPEQLTQEDLAYMARYASAAASLSTEKSGAIPSIPAKEAVLQKMQEAY